MFVERTCTVLEGGDAQGAAHEAVHPIALSLQVENGTLDWQDVRSAMSGSETSGEPLSCYAERPAWVLLAPAGAGKTTAFLAEKERPGAYYTTARDFVSPTNKQKREWQHGTIFIDALDELRASAKDRIKPLVKIRKMLDDLHKPAFRISCRESDWFGINDRSRLASVAQDGRVLVLRLDPLTDDDIRRLLAEWKGVEFAQEFVLQAEKHGLRSLLNNPQTLDLLARAVVAGGKWPDSRTETFELACRQIVRECNQDHLIGATQPSSGALLDAAGKLCAVSLLSDHVGYAVRTTTPRNYISLSEIRGTQQIPQTQLEDASRTLLFDHPKGEQCAVPAHRQIGEFLAARYLAQLVENGLPDKRITALATGQDDGIVAGLRGLVAWLAALDQGIRSDRIERDPIDTMLYGDVRRFSPDDKRYLVQRIKERANDDPWLLRNRFDLNARWGDLATKDAEPMFREELTNIQPGDAGQLLAENLLRALYFGDERLPLGDVLFEIVRNQDDQRWQEVRAFALEVLVRHHGDESSVIDQLQELLREVEDGALKDPLDQLRGILLTHLYPDHLGPAEIVQHLHEPKRFDEIGTYLKFCDSVIIEKSTEYHLERLLDGLCGQEVGDVLQALCNKALRHLLKDIDDVPVERLFNWLSIERERKTKDELAHWLTARPHRYKGLIAEAAKRSEHILETMSWSQGCEPPDFGKWCLGQAVEAKEDALAKFYIEGAYYCLYFERGCEGLSEDVVTRRIPKHPHLEKHWFDMKRRRTQHEAEFVARASTRDNRTADWRKPWQDWLRDHAREVRTNCPPGALYELGRMSLGKFGLAGDTPAEHLHSVLQDETLVELALDAIRDTPKRNDLPSVAEVAKRERAYLFATPFAAALELSPRPTLDRGGTMLALAFRFHSGGLGDWYESVLKTQPAALVANTLLTYCRTAFKHRNFPSFMFLAEPKHAAVTQSVALKLLKAFPPRCSTEHLPALQHLLVAALKHARDGLPELVRHKAGLSSMTLMQRVYWLCCGLGLDAANHREDLIKTLTGRGEYERMLCAIRLMGGGVLPVNDHLDVEAAAALVEHLGSRWPPSSLWASKNAANSRFAIVGSAVDAADASDAVKRLIDHLASLSESAATEALRRLAENALLERWQDRLRHALRQQRETRREAEFQYATVAQVLETLDGGNPANSADLAVLTTDHLRQLAESIARGNTSAWELFWNLAKGLREPREENLCRNALLQLLRERLPKGVDAEREGPYAADRRADIRVSCKGFNVPVEIKKSTHRELWTAIGTQLMEYADDPGADGHGIYLVLWFGPVDCQKPPDGEKPETPQQLEDQLRRRLTPEEEEERKIDVVVVDVSDQKRAATGV